MAKYDKEVPLPQIKYSKTLNGVELIDYTDTVKGMLPMFLVTIFWNGIMYFFIRMMFFKTHDDGTSIWVKFFMIPFVLVGLFLVYKLIKQLIVVLRLKPGRLQISPWPIIPGGEVKVKFTRSASGNSNFHNIEARIKLIEVAIYRVGTGSRTVTKTSWEKEIGKKQLFETSNVSESFNFKIPENMPSSLNASNNRLRWEFETLVEFDNTSDDSVFELLVLPMKGAIND